MRGKAFSALLGAVLAAPVALYLAARIYSSLEVQPAPLAITYRVVMSLAIMLPAVVGCVMLWRTKSVGIRLVLLGSFGAWWVVALTGSFVLGI